MKKVATYIACIVFLGGFALAGQKDKAISLSGHSAIAFDSPVFIEDDGAVVERKRAHKRKRRIRPRRNGF